MILAGLVQLEHWRRNDTQSEEQWTHKNQFFWRHEDMPSAELQ
jgi:hypothetical protein